ncbi:hypothetical protein B9G69_008290 [Bdellovibrio sp. SKB1291214]|uniref:hypothetical protein n=1 Tax=Bdellovibrio sp. SKB1291214 TaxID=1732569 RepID=UPI000B517E6B|nr:hypothetical protein [Bdellovibrio sp. SKB1291214]UYL10573.1 hypothetical protein B9G69_008290 [Bdellovibrio sp. SKB1291214]
MKLHLSPIIHLNALVSLVLLIMTSVSMAATPSLEIEGNPEEQGLVETYYDPQSLVELHVRQDNLADYKTRRETHGVYFGINYENYIPVSFVSANDGKTYNELFNGDSISILSLLIDYKFNFVLGSIALGGSAGMGSISDNRSGDTRTLEVTKYMGTLKYTIDNLMKEPYVAPYVGFSMYQMELNDKSTTSSISESTPTSYAYTLGLLLQLDWLDNDTAKSATFNYGLENTFLDVFMSQYLSSGGDADANMETDPIWGVGLRMEF